MAFIKGKMNHAFQLLLIPQTFQETILAPP